MTAPPSTCLPELVFLGLPVAVLLFFYCILRVQIWNSSRADRISRLHFRAFVLSVSASAVMAALGFALVDSILVIYLLPAFGFAVAALFHRFWYRQYRQTERGNI